MSSTSTVYDLVRVLADQQAGLTECLASVDSAIEDMDADALIAANADILLITSIMEHIAGEIADQLDPDSNEEEETEEYYDDDDCHM